MEEKSMKILKPQTKEPTRRGEHFIIFLKKEPKSLNIRLSLQVAQDPIISSSIIHINSPKVDTQRHKIIEFQGWKELYSLNTISFHSQPSTLVQDK